MFRINLVIPMYPAQLGSDIVPKVGIGVGEI